jgi:hypothetical protein
MALVATTAVTAPAADNAVPADATPSVGQPAEIAPELSGDGSEPVVKPKKSRKKAPLPDPEPLPGQKLTLKQVMNYIKTTRNLSGRNLSGLNLVGIDFSRCNMRGAELSHADLERADLGGSNLERADLSGANLKMVTFHLAGMTGVKLDKADLSGAIWRDGGVCPPGSIGRCSGVISSP